MEAGHKHELQSIKWKIADLDLKIDKGRKQKKKISHWLEEKKNLTNRKLEIETGYNNKLRNDNRHLQDTYNHCFSIGEKEKQKTSLWESLLGFLGVR